MALDSKSFGDTESDDLALGRSSLLALGRLGSASSWARGLGRSELGPWAVPNSIGRHLNLDS